MRADPPFGDFYLLYREKDYGRKKLPGFIVSRGGPEALVFTTIDEAFDYIRKQHDQRLKGNE